MALVPLHTNDNKDEYKAPHSIPTVHITICITYDIFIRIKLLNLSYYFYEIQIRSQHALCDMHTA